jgi:hypothetical protein
MARPRQLPERPYLTVVQVKAAAYVGSKEHKVAAWWDGLPGAYVDRNGKAKRPKKQQTTICPLVTIADRAKASCWVRDALGNNQFLHFEGDKTYPKHIWYKDINGQHWFGFCINSIAGTYKGWPIDESEKRETFG